MLEDRWLAGTGRCKMDLLCMCEVEVPCWCKVEQRDLGVTSVTSVTFMKIPRTRVRESYVGWRIVRELQEFRGISKEF